MVLADIGDTIDRGFETFFEWVPALLGALVILIIGWIVAGWIGKLVARLLGRAGLDRAMHGGPGGGFVQKVTTSPSRLLGTIAKWAVLLAAISIAVSVLGIEALSDFVDTIFGYLPNVLAALLIFLVAGAIAAGISGVVGRIMGDTALGKIIATAAPILVMTIATFMILEQLKIAENIVTITYAALLGAIALGSALAFGLGGRDVARQILDGAYQKGQENKEQYRQEFQEGKERAREQMDEAKDRLQEQGGGGGGDDRAAMRETTVVRPTPPSDAA